jgi:hypothetical protein
MINNKYKFVKKLNPINLQFLFVLLRWENTKEKQDFNYNLKIINWWEKINCQKIVKNKDI